MIIHSIEVEGWKCFRNPVRLGGFGLGINVVHAPNGSGKSTLFEAVQRALVDGHRTGGADVQRMQPWGTGLAPRVTLEFEQRGVRYRITKQFLKGSSSLLERQSGGTWERLDQDDSADETVRAMLFGLKPGRGLSTPDHWGIAQVLWAPQGLLELGQLGGDVQARIRGALDQQAAGPDGGPLERLIGERYLQLFTSRTGRLRSDARLNELESQLRQLEQDEAAAAQRYAQFEAAQLALDDRSRERERCEQGIGTATRELAELRDLAAEHERLRSAERTHDARFQQLRSEHAAMTQRIDQLARARAALTSELAQQQAAAAQEPEAAQRNDDAQQQLRTAQRAVEDARTAQQQALQERSLVQAAQRFIAASARQQQLERQLAQVTAAEQAIADLRSRRAGVLAPARGDIDAMRELYATAARLGAEIDAAMVMLEIVPQHAADLDVRRADEPGARSVAAGEAVILRGEAEVELSWPGVGTVRARGPRTDVAQLRQQLESARQRLDELTAPFGTDDITELAARVEHAAVLDGELREQQARLDALLGGSDRPAVEAGLAQAAAGLARILAEHPAWEHEPPDVAALEAAVEQRIEQAHATVTAASDAQQQAARHAQQCGQELDRLRSEQETLDRLIASRRATIDELQHHDGLDDEQRRARALELARMSDVEEAALTDVRAQLSHERFADDPAARLERLQARVTDLRSQLDTAIAATASETTKLGALAGAYTEHVQLQERLESLRAACARERDRAAAIKALHAAVESCRAEVQAQFAEPVVREATAILQRIGHWSALGDMRVDDGFLPQGFSLPGAGEHVELDQLSGGEREQVHLAVRLALARTLAREERQLVVIDDGLVYTDPRRFDRVLGVIEEEARDLQVVLLTCDPARYAGITDAVRFDLEALV